MSTIETEETIVLETTEETIGTAGLTTTAVKTTIAVLETRPPGAMTLQAARRTIPEATANKRQVKQRQKMTIRRRM